MILQYQKCKAFLGMCDVRWFCWLDLRCWCRFCYLVDLFDCSFAVISSLSVCTLFFCEFCFPIATVQSSRWSRLVTLEFLFQANKGTVQRDLVVALFALGVEFPLGSRWRNSIWASFCNPRQLLTGRFCTCWRVRLRWVKSSGVYEWLSFWGHTVPHRFGHNHKTFSSWTA